MSEDTGREIREIIALFSQMLRNVSDDGGRKRMAGTKLLWKFDPEHESAIYSHLMKWKRGEQHDPDSGAHPMAHAGWRCLAIAAQEMHNTAQYGAVVLNVEAWEKVKDRIEDPKMPGMVLCETDIEEGKE